MSLEAKIDALTAAVEKLNTTSENLLALRSAAIDEIKGAATAAKAPAKAAAKKAEDAPAKTAEETPAAAAGDAGTNRLAEVQAVCAKYAGGSDRTEERDARKAKLTWLFGKVGAKKLAEIPEGKEAAVIKAVNQLIADGDLTEAPAEDAAPAEAADDDLLAG